MNYNKPNKINTIDLLLIKITQFTYLTKTNVNFIAIMDKRIESNN